MSYATIACQGLVAAVVATAAGSKLSRRAFGGFVVSTGLLLPRRWWRWRRPAAVTVIAAELATALLVVLPRLAVAGFGLAVVLSVLFAGGVTGALHRGERAPCRCFGAAATPLGRVHLVRNGLLGAVGLSGLATLLLGSATPVHPAGVVAAVAIGLVLAAVVIRLDDLVALFTSSHSTR